MDGAAGDDWQAVQRDFLERRHMARQALPVRLGIGALHEMGGDALEPMRLDDRDRARVEPGRLDQLRRRDPRRVAFEQAGAGMDVELDAAGAEVFVGLGGACSARGLSIRGVTALCRKLVR